MDVIKLLLVEDDEVFRTVIKECLELTGKYEIYVAKNGQDGYDSFLEHKLDIIVTDIDMPTMSGLAMIDFIRKEDKKIPILVISGLTASKNVHEGFEREIDNYIKKPFQPEELDDFIESTLRRVRNANRIGTEESNQFRLGSYLFDYNNLCLIHKKTIQLTVRESQILYLLYKNKGNVVKREDILNEFWDKNGIRLCHSRSLDVFISNLRKYLKKDKSVKIITLRGEGLKLIF